MKNKITLVFAVFLTLQFTNLTAQIDTSFWFAAPWVTPDHTQRHNIVVHLSTFAATTTTIHIVQPAAIAPNKYDTTFVLGPNQTFDYIFWRDKLSTSTDIGFDSLETRPADVVVPYGLHISSSSSITVVYDVITAPPGYNNSETFSLKGRNALGLEFVCPQQTLYRNRTLSDRFNTPPGVMQPKQQITIVASMSNTVVWITPKCNIIGHLANVSYSVLLPNAGSSYNIENSAQSTYISGQNLSGTIITADKPIAVTVADDSINSIHSSPAALGFSAWGGMGCYDLIGDQIVPVRVLGKDYIVNRGRLYNVNDLGAGNPGMKESAFVVATENTTQLTIIAGTNTLSAIINKGDTYVDTITSDLTYIHADKNVYVYHVSGIGCELGAALLPPLNCAGSKLVSFSRNTPQLFSLNILCKNGSQSTFTLNGSTILVPPTAFTLVPGTTTLNGGPYWGAQLSLPSTTIFPIGSYTLGNATDEFAMGVFDGAFTSGGLYHYTTSFMNIVNVKTNTLSTLCVKNTNTIALTGTVSGADATGVWTIANGSGTFAPYTSSVNIISTTYSLSASDTLQNTLKFYLTSAGNCIPVKDSVSVVINQRPKIFVSGNITICRNNVTPVVLSGTITNAASGIWSGGNGGVWNGSGVSTVYTLSGLDILTPSVVFTLTSQTPLPGCVNSSKTFTVSFIDPPIINAGNDVIICGKTTPGVGLYGSLSGITTIGMWSSSGTGTFLPGVNSSTVSYLFSSSDYLATSFIFTLTSINNGLCSSVKDVVKVERDTASVTINLNPAEVCAGMTSTITASGTGSFLWNTSQTSSLLVVSPAVTTSYTVTGTTSLNCSYSETAILVVNQIPPVKAVTSNSIICVGESLVLSSTGALTYTWTTIPSYSPSVIVSPSVTTSYLLIGKDGKGCKNIDSVSVSVSECTTLESFTEKQPVFMIYPNPANGEFTIKTQIDFDFKIYNQFGQLVKIIEMKGQNQQHVSVHSFAKGVYFIRGFKGDYHFNQKIVIE